MLPPLDVEAWRAALDGPPRAFALDGELYELAGRWSILLGVLPLVEWHMPFVSEMVHADDAARLLDRLDDDGDDLTMSDVEAAVEGVVEAATGRRWWVAQRLYATLAAEWSALDGALTLAAGVDLVELLQAPARVCNVVYAHLTAGADPGRLIAFDARLSRPPAGLDTRARPVVTPEQEGAAFMSAMAGTRGGRVRATVPRPAPDTDADTDAGGELAAAGQGVYGTPP